MAYARRYPKRAPPRRTRAPVRRTRKVAVPKKKRTAKTYVRNNARAINTLHRDIKYLKMAQHGSFQMSRQMCYSFNVNDQQVVAIPVDQFDAKRDVMVGDPNANPPYSNTIAAHVNGTPVFVAKPSSTALEIATQWQPQAGFKVDTTAGGGKALWEGINHNIPDSGKYFCDSAHYQINMSCIAQSRNIIFTLMYQLPKGIVKNTVLSDTQYSAVMPNALRYMTKLSTFTGPGVHLPTNRYKVLWSKRFSFNSLTHGDGNKTMASTGNRRQFSFTIRPKKVVKQLYPVPSDHNDPSVADTILVPSGTRLNPYAWGPFGPNQRGLCEPLYLLITSDVPASASAVSEEIAHDCPHPLEVEFFEQNPDATELSQEALDAMATNPEHAWISMTRTCKWRDHQGGIL